MHLFFSPARLVFASGLILLSPKRAMRQLCSLCSHNAQPLGTGRQPLDAVGRGLFPFTNFFVFLLHVHPRLADDGYSKSVGRIRAKHGLTHRHRLCKKNERVANRLTRLDVILFPFTLLGWVEVIFSEIPWMFAFA